MHVLLKNKMKIKTEFKCKILTKVEAKPSELKKREKKSLVMTSGSYGRTNKNFRFHNVFSYFYHCSSVSSTSKYLKIFPALAC